MAEQQSSNSAVLAVVTFYMCSALVMVMTNKWVLNSSELPLTFLFFQLLLSVVCLMGLSLLPSTHRFAFTPPRWNRSTIVAVAPVCTANVVGLAFNIYCLKLVDASYFQVARGLTLPMTVVLQSMVTGEKPTLGTIASCGIVTWGFTYSFLPNPASFLSGADVAPIESSITGVGSGEAPMLGMIFGVLSAAMVAIHAVLIKAALRSVDGKTLDLAYWSNALSALALIPGIAVSGELGGMWRLIQGQEGSLSAFVLGTTLTGLVGFLICVAGLLSIKVTSPVTHMFSSAVRSVLQTMLGVWLFKDILNANRVVSIFLILAGSLLYTYLKSRPRLSPEAAAHTDKSEEEAIKLLTPSDLEKGESPRRRSPPNSPKERIN